jgi:hypothetical protein
VRQNEGVLFNQPVKVDCVKQAAFLRPPAFQAGCHEPLFHLLLNYCLCNHPQQSFQL